MSAGEKLCSTVQGNFVHLHRACTRQFLPGMRLDACELNFDFDAHDSSVLQNAAMAWDRLMRMTTPIDAGARLAPPYKPGLSRARDMALQMITHPRGGLQLHKVQVPEYEDDPLMQAEREQKRINLIKTVCSAAMCVPAC